MEVKGSYERKVTGGFLVLRLFFRQEPGERDNVEVDLLLPSASNRLAVAIGAVSSHVEKLFRQISSQKDTETTE